MMSSFVDGQNLSLPEIPHHPSPQAASFSTQLPFFLTSHLLLINHQIPIPWIRPSKFGALSTETVDYRLGSIHIVSDFLSASYVLSPAKKQILGPFFICLLLYATFIVSSDQS
jgi:hypothetical protein